MMPIAPEPPPPPRGAAHEEDLFHALVDGVKEYAIYMLDAYGRIVTWSAGAERITGFREDEILGAHVSRFYPPEDVAAGRPAQQLALARARGTYEEESVRIRKDGSRFVAHVVVTAIPAADGTLRGFAKVVRDMTERKRAEEQQRRLAHAQEALRTRDEFLTIASHELKTPLTALQLHLDALAREGDDGDQRARRLEVVRRQVARITSLVQSLLDVAQLLSGELRLSPAPVALAPIVDRALDGCRDAIEGSGTVVRASVAEGLGGQWDGARVEQAIRAILHNALKYGMSRPVDLTAERAGAVVRIRIRDRGMGLTPDDASRVFERFERAVPVEHFGGFGVGLWIASRVIAAHGGSIRVESVPGEGATFDVELPAD
jgi:PAS domain S-box-containing protein